MKFYLSSEEITLLNLMLLSPKSIGNEKFSAYHIDPTRESDGKNYMRLKSWLIKTILEPAKDENGKVITGAFVVPKSGKWTSLQGPLVDKLKEIIEYYGPYYCVVPIAEAYVMLKYKLNNNGKEIEIESDFGDPLDQMG